MNPSGLSGRCYKLNWKRPVATIVATKKAIQLKAMRSVIFAHPWINRYSSVIRIESHNCSAESLLCDDANRTIGCIVIYCIAVG